MPPRSSSSAYPSLSGRRSFGCILSPSTTTAYRWCGSSMRHIHNRISHRLISNRYRCSRTFAFSNLIALASYLISFQFFSWKPIYLFLDLLGRILPHNLFQFLRGLFPNRLYGYLACFLFAYIQQIFGFLFAKVKCLFAYYFSFLFPTSRAFLPRSRALFLPTSRAFLPRSRAFCLPTCSSFSLPFFNTLVPPLTTLPQNPWP